MTWIDINAPYYPTYYSAYPNNMGGRTPLDDREMKQLGQLTGINWGAEVNFDRNTGPWVSFDRPELSPCLAKFTGKDDPKYKEALSLIQTGKERLTQRPRGDLADFQPCEKDLQREAFYQERLQIEWRNREAVLKGEKMYDSAREPRDGTTRSTKD